MRCYASEQIFFVLYVLDNILNGGGLSVCVCVCAQNVNNCIQFLANEHIFALPQGIN